MGLTWPPLPPPVPSTGFLFGNFLLWWVLTDDLAFKQDCRQTKKNQGRPKQNYIIVKRFWPRSPCGDDTRPPEHMTWALNQRHGNVEINIASWFWPQFTLWFPHQAPRAYDMSSQLKARVSWFWVVNEEKRLGIFLQKQQKHQKTSTTFEDNISNTHS